jgi:hypothetical protein
VIALLLLTFSALAEPRSPDVIIGIVGAGSPLQPSPVPYMETLLVYQPGILALPVAETLTLRPHITYRYGLGQGQSVSLGVQFVWIRPR